MDIIRQIPENYFILGKELGIEHGHITVEINTGIMW
jgi:hypothetical protein